ncbi:MAG TPA: hypothetical protein VGB91_04570 [Rhizomicrobium sp.]
MTHLNRYAGVLAAVLFALLFAAPANAQATRTWVSGVGDDANPCSRTAPCKTFAGAISKTAVNGEINCLDPGGFGAVTITKSIALVCDYTEGGITNPNTAAITVNAAGGIVYLTGIDIEGIAAGTIGINFIQGSALHIDHCKIRGNNAAGSATGFGIRFAPNAAATLYVSDTLIADNGAGSGSTATGGGVLIQPVSGGSAIALLDRVRLENNTNGFSVNTTTAGAGISSAVLTDSTVSGDAIGIAAVAAGTQAVVTANHTMITNGSLYGVVASGTQAQAIVGTSVITANGTALFPTGGGATVSYGDNEIGGNTSAGTITVTAPKS